MRQCSVLFFRDSQRRWSKGARNDGNLDRSLILLSVPHSQRKNEAAIKFELIWKWVSPLAFCDAFHCFISVILMAAGVPLYEFRTFHKHLTASVAVVPEPELQLQHRLMKSFEPLHSTSTQAPGLAVFRFFQAELMQAGNNWKVCNLQVGFSRLALEPVYVSEGKSGTNTRRERRIHSKRKKRKKRRSSTHCRSEGVSFSKQWGMAGFGIEVVKINSLTIWYFTWTAPGWMFFSLGLGCRRSERLICMCMS